MSIGVVIVWILFRDHIIEISWVQLASHIQKILSGSRCSSPLVLTVFLPLLSQCFMSFSCKDCVADISVGLGTPQLLIFCILTSW